MPAKERFDFRKVDWPICLMNCKRKLDGMPGGGEMEIVVQDLDMVVDLVRIVQCSQAEVIKNEQRENCCLLVVRKNHSVGDS